MRGTRGRPAQHLSYVGTPRGEQHTPAASPLLFARIPVRAEGNRSTNRERAGVRGTPRQIPPSPQVGEQRIPPPFALREIEGERRARVRGTEGRPAQHLSYVGTPRDEQIILPRPHCFLRNGMPLSVPLRFPSGRTDKGPFIPTPAHDKSPPPSLRRRMQPRKPRPQTGLLCPRSMPLPPFAPKPPPVRPEGNRRGTGARGNLKEVRRTPRYQREGPPPVRPAASPRSP